MKEHYIVRRIWASHIEHEARVREINRQERTLRYGFWAGMFVLCTPALYVLAWAYRRIIG